MKYTLVFIGLFLPAIFNPASAGGLSEQIRFFVENKPEGDRYRIDETRLFSSQLLPRFYYNRFFTPAWLSDAGLNEHAHHLINAIRHVDEHGLQPEDYHLEMIEKFLNQKPPLPMISGWYKPSAYCPPCKGFRVFGPIQLNLQRCFRCPEVRIFDSPQKASSLQLK